MKCYIIVITEEGELPVLESYGEDVESSDDCLIVWKNKQNP